MKKTLDEALDTLYGDVDTLKDLQGTTSDVLIQEILEVCDVKIKDTGTRVGLMGNSERGAYYVAKKIKTMIEKFKKE